MNIKMIKRKIYYSIKRPLIHTWYKCINILLAVIPMKNIIIFESNPDFACNSYEVFRYIVNQEMFSQLQLMWLVDSPEKKIYSHERAIEYLPINPISIKDKIKKYIWCNKAKIMIDCNRHYPHYKTSAKQINIFLDHGMPLKWMGNAYGLPLDLSCGYLVSQSHFFNKFLKMEYEVDDEQIFVGGVPRNDQFFKEDVTLDALYSDYLSFDHIIAWMPTFRQIQSTGRVDCISNQPLGLPILYTEEDIIKLENKLKDLNILLIIKPHPVQDLTILKNLNCHNIRIVYNNEMLAKGIQTNELLKQCDAMITDYSGIYYDYLLMDRPIAITLDDYEAYKEQKGFMFEDPLEVLKGFQIYNISDMINFFQSVHNGNDIYLDERKLVKQKVYDWIDGNSAKRVCDFISIKYNNVWRK